MEKLVKDGIFPNFDFSDLSICVECIKDKLTFKVSKNKMTVCEDGLELIHIDICGPFTPPTLGSYIYLLYLLMISSILDTWSLFMRSLIPWLLSKSLR